MKTVLGVLAVMLWAMGMGGGGRALAIGGPSRAGEVVTTEAVDGACVEGGWTDLPLLPAPVLVGLQVRPDPAGGSDKVTLCYVPTGTPRAAEGLVKVAPDTTGHRAAFQCLSRAKAPCRVEMAALETGTRRPRPGRADVGAGPRMPPSGMVVYVPVNMECVWVPGGQLMRGCSRTVAEARMTVDGMDASGAGVRLAGDTLRTGVSLSSPAGTVAVNAEAPTPALPLWRT
ncbi:MAG TPA: hypothetical protein VGO92_03855 [Acidimicrobiales bacterium]|nr:hypothetical protein [Acidimicrobiales bacterium]